MKPRITYHFDWDLTKAASNHRKHGVEFTAAMTVFSDPLSLTCHDSEHSELEERWITIGLTSTGTLIVVAHTFRERNAREAHIRIISARKATVRERWQYENGQFSVHEGTTMRDEYDFSGAERGKFYRKDAVFEMPVYLKPDVLAFFVAQAAERGITVDELLNEVLTDDIARMKAGG